MASTCEITDCVYVQMISLHVTKNRKILCPKNECDYRSVGKRSGGDHRRRARESPAKSVGAQYSQTQMSLSPWQRGLLPHLYLPWEAGRPFRRNQTPENDVQRPRLRMYAA